MAVFETDPAAWQRLDLRLLQNGPIAMYWRRTILDEDVAWLRESHYDIDAIDCARWRTPEIAHADFAERLDFPSYYGRNLNAFNDCMSDLVISEVAGRVLALTRFDVPAQAMPTFVENLLDIIAIQARHHLLFGRRLLALVQTDHPHLELPAVGAIGVGFNPREWLASSRGN